ncbi:MAG: hypothetical protein AAF651_01170 [Cyanobacteria bacterium P01_C01_bin.73]
MNLRRYQRLAGLGIILTIAIACAPAPDSPPPEVSNDPSVPIIETEAAEPDLASPSDTVAVTAVTVSGEPGSYQFEVTLSSTDTGCDAYADWWEVITPDGELLYRRILAHSHVEEQPFTRSGGPVAIAPTDTVIVRGHFASQDATQTGYGAIAQQGSVSGGFERVEFDQPVAAAIAAQPPLPSGCSF